MAVSAEQFVVLMLSISCRVLGDFLLTHKGVRMMRGGSLYRLSIGLAARTSRKGRPFPLVHRPNAEGVSFDWGSGPPGALTPRGM